MPATQGHTTMKINYTVTKTTTEELKFAAGYSHHSIGGHIDNWLSEAVMEGETVSNVSLEISPEEWTQFSKAVREHTDLSVEVDRVIEPARAVKAVMSKSRI